MRKAFDLRPLEFGDILSRSFALYVANFTLFASLFLIFVFVPTALLELGKFAFSTPAKVNSKFDGSAAFINVGTWLLQTVLSWALAGGGIYYLVSRVYLGAKTTIGEALRAIIRQSGALLATGVIVLVVCAILIGLVAVPFVMFMTDYKPAALGWAVLLCMAVVPVALFLYGRYGLVFSVVMLEDMNADEAFSRSARLTSGYTWRLIGIFVVMYLCFWLVSLPGLVLQSAMSGGNPGVQLAGALISAAWSALVAPVLAIPPVIYYFDLRCRKEGFDLSVLAATFGVDPNFMATLQAQGRYSYDIPGYLPKGWDAGRAAQSVVAMQQQAVPQPQPGNPFAFQGYAPGGYTQPAGHAPQNFAPPPPRMPLARKRPPGV